ncbi:hypothetical protein OPT61_g4967 [Boeremia exigua]|uniref:Uncharacterized protein n=1 Tax=Boeremia exigua TaxID=749465 RepID=A0ACC2IC65_9PLEO|nr:hypothetical protein OPT61_g4967 [Boeremia exigua]
MFNIQPRRLFDGRTRSVTTMLSSLYSSPFRPGGFKPRKTHPFCSSARMPCICENNDSLAAASESLAAIMLAGMAGDEFKVHFQYENARS